LRLRTALLIASVIPISIATIALVPSVRTRVFTTKLWPWPLPFDTNDEELSLLQGLIQPGDIIVEANLHSWQWIALCTTTLGSSWVHTALVDDQNKLLTMDGVAVQTDFAIFKKWTSTRLAIIRPPYKDAEQRHKVIASVKKHLGAAYDHTFVNPNGYCNGLIGAALNSVGIPVQTVRTFGKNIYSAHNFFKIPNAVVVWNSDLHRKPKAIKAAASQKLQESIAKASKLKANKLSWKRA